MSELKARLTNDMKDAMRAKDKDRLLVIRLILAALKQKEVDERIELTDSDVLVILDKLCKQRRESISQYQAANRQDLVDVEQKELVIIQEYLPAQLTEAELKAMITAAISQSEAKTVQDMGKVMALIKPQAQGRADMGAVSQWIKAALVG